MILGFTPAATPTTRASGLTVFLPGHRDAVRDAGIRLCRCRTEFVAYRPLRRRNARPLTFWITAIGMSFVIQEFVHFIRRKLIHGYGGNANSRSSWCNREVQFHGAGRPRQQRDARDHRGRHRFRTADRHRDQPHQVRPRHPCGCAGPDDGHADGVSRERVIMTTFLIGDCSPGGGAALHPAKVPQGGSSTRADSCWASRHSPPPSSAVSATCAAPCWAGLILGVMENYGQMLFGTQWRDVVAFVLLVLVLLIRPTASWVKAWGRRAYDRPETSSGPGCSRHPVTACALVGWNDPGSEVGIRRHRIRGDGAAAHLHRRLPEHPGSASVG